MSVDREQNVGPRTDAADALAAFEALAGLPKLSEITRVAEGVLLDAGRAPFTDRGRYAEKVAELGLTAEDGVTPFGNALDVLERGPEDAAEKCLAAALAAHALADASRHGKGAGRDAEDGRARDLLRLSTRSGIDALPLLDRALGDDAADVWTSIAEGVRQVDSGVEKTLSRAEAIVGAAAIAASKSDGALLVRRKLMAHVRDPLLVRVLDSGGDGLEGSGESRRLEGELTDAPRSSLRTAVLAVTGVLFALSLLRLLGALALVYKRPAEIVVSKSGVRVRAKTVLLGRTLREIDTHIALASLVRASREVRYPRAGLYAGLFALAVGSYVGLSAFVDGVRAASPSMMLTGLVIVALGIALDYVLGAAFQGAKGKCLVAFEPSSGAKVCLAGVDPKSADLALSLLRKG